MMDGTGMMVWGVLSFLLGLLLIFFFIVAVAAALKWIWGESRLFGRGDTETALVVLKKRYARGEIGREEYERIKKDFE